MRLALVNNYLYYRGGAEKVFRDQKELFREKGHDVFLFSQNHIDNLPDENQSWFPRWSDPKKAGFITGLPRLLKFIYSHGNRKIFRRFLQRFQPDLVHAHNLYGGLTMAVIDAAVELDIPVVMTLHDYKMISPSPNLLSGIEPCRECLVHPGALNCVWKKCHRGNFKSTLAYYCETWFNRRFKKYHKVKTFIVPSQYMKNTITTAGVDPNVVKVVPNAIPLGPPPTFNVKGGYYFYAGRMSDEKGVRPLLEAFESFSGHLILAGDGPQMENYKKIAKGKNNIQFVGQLDQTRMDEHYRRCTAVVIPSLWPETSSMTALQAMANGKPVVASRVGALAEIVEDGVTGFLFEPGNVKQLTGLLKDLDSHKALAERMGENARVETEKKYSQERQYETLMGIYEMVLRKGN
jgi:glycosyltransferase involved in cell wall biosynthesis